MRARKQKIHNENYVCAKRSWASLAGESPVAEHIDFEDINPWKEMGTMPLSEEVVGIIATKKQNP